MRAAVLCLLLATATATAAFAQPADKLETIRAQQQLLATELDTGVLELTPRQLALLRKDQARVQAILGANASLDQLSVEERVEFDNALERINALVVGTRRAAPARIATSAATSAPPARSCASSSA